MVYDLRQGWPTLVDLRPVNSAETSSKCATKVEESTRDKKSEKKENR